MLACAKFTENSVVMLRKLCYEKKYQCLYKISAEKSFSIHWMGFYEKWASYQFFDQKKGQKIVL